MFQREANSEELAERLKKLELSVVQDVLPQEICDYADYVLPSTYFMERMEMSGVKWARDGSIYLSDPQLSPPEGCEARHDVWILLEILRRAFPERAARVGYKECKTAEEFNAYFDAFTKRGYAQLLEECDKSQAPVGLVGFTRTLERKVGRRLRLKSTASIPIRNPSERLPAKLKFILSRVSKNPHMCEEFLLSRHIFLHRLLLRRRETVTSLF